MKSLDTLGWQLNVGVPPLIVECEEESSSPDKQVDDHQVINKQKVAAAFSQAACCYDSAAKLQQWVLDWLVQQLPTLPDNSIIVDLGCGTGKGLRQLKQHYPKGLLVGLDLAYGMLAHAKSSHTEAAKWCCGDGEMLPLKPGSIDLVFSSLAIQWCQSFPQLLEQIYQSLKPGGYFVFSTLIKGTLAELSQAWQGVDNYVHVNNYPSADWHYQQIKQSAFQLVQATNRQEVVCEASLKALLQGLKAIGAGTVNGARRAGLMTRQQYRQLSSQYEVFRLPEGLPATYQVLYTVLKKTND